MIKVFWGGDSFSIQVALNREVANKPEESITILRETDIASFNNEALTNSFFDNKKTLVVHDFLAKVSKEKQEKSLIKILDNIAPETDIIFIESTEPRAVLRKYLAQIAETKQFGRLPAKDLVDYIRDRAEELSIQISPLAAERFSTYVGSDFWQIEEELKKLSLYKKEDTLDQTIDTTDVDLLVKSGFEANIFELMDAISQRNKNRAISLLDSFLESGENEIYILTMIARQFRNIAMAKGEKNITESTLAKKAKLHPFVAKKSIMQARNFTPGEIADIYERISQADLALKSGHNPRQVLQSIILN